MLETSKSEKKQQQNAIEGKGGVDLQVASSLPVAMASPLGWNFTLLISEVWP